MKKLDNKISSFCIGGTSSGDGKTTITLALLRALSRRGLAPQPFKCGPDYIDPSFHNASCIRYSRNLDCWMMGMDQVKTSFSNAIADAGCAVVEGVMGLFDSSSPGSLEGSTAETVSVLGIPVILTVNCKGMAGSIAAIVKGYSEFHPDVNVIGVIANKVGSDNHAKILSEALKAADMPPLLGHLPLNECWTLPERHLGLLPFTENSKSEAWFDELADAAEKYIDIDRILELSKIKRPLSSQTKISRSSGRLAIAYDEAFHFYYEDNLDMFRQNGIELVKFSPLHDSILPEGIGGIYIGGGFPEVFAEQLEKNKAMRAAIKNFAEAGGIVYAECGGFMYLASNLEARQMCGIVPAEIRMGSKLRSLGYREIKTAIPTFFGPAGTIIRGHEFHWSEELFTEDVIHPWQYRNARETEYSTFCGYSCKNVCASYIHLHFASCPAAAMNLSNALKSAR